MEVEELTHQIALTLVSGVGDKTAKNLIAHCGSAQAVFKEKPALLSKVPGVGVKSTKAFTKAEIFTRAEKEIRFIQDNRIKPLFFLDKDYPKRLRACEDGPLLLFQKGEIDFNRYHNLAIVGTRNATSYGLEFCERFAKELTDYKVNVVSGLAYGIDIKAHRESIKHKIPTVAVLAHGLDRIYPSVHRQTARLMEENGALLTEFLSETNPDRENFPKRNRIIAGMAEAVIVVEAAKKGGALITAEIANTYNRDVFAVPGKLKDTYSEGCNYLIKINKAALFTGVQDLKYLLGWESINQQNIQNKLFVELSPVEKKIKEALEESEKRVELDNLCIRLNLPLSKVIPTLLNLELKGIVKSHPGKLFELT
jgi:DNA processing protein